MAMVVPRFRRSSRANGALSQEKSSRLCRKMALASASPLIYDVCNPGGFMKTLLLAVLVSCTVFSSFALAKRPPPNGFVCGRDTSLEEGPTCVSTGCALLGGDKGACRWAAAVQDVEDACMNNTTGNCLSSSCGIIGERACAGMAAIKTVGASCQGACDHSCAAAACGFIGCRNASDVADVNMACTGTVSGACVTSHCNKLGCRTLDDVRQATRACGGVN